MSMIQWNDSYSLHVGSVDDEHKQLMSIANDLHAAMMRREGAEEMQRIIEELKAYVRTHFTNEEGLMARNNYPDLEAHKQEHRRLIESVLDLEVQHKDNDLIAPELLKFLRQWLIDHIMNMDVKYAKFITAQGEN